MNRNLKALGLAMFAVLALGALTAQGASAAKEQEFRSAGSWTVGTGAAAMNLAIGAAGTVKCNGNFEDQSGGTKVGEEYLSDTLTVTPSFSECSYGGNPATVKVNHCAFVVDSDLTEGNTTGGEFANAEIECEAGQKIEISTTICTITVAAQLVKHAINYPADTAVTVSGEVAAHGIVVGNLADKGGCALIPKGAVGVLKANGTTSCFKDEGSVLTGTEKTTPQTKTTEGAPTECSVK